MQRLRPFLIVLMLAGCALPDIDVPEDAELARADYPELLPLSAVIAAERARATRATPEDTAALASRAQALRARAAALRGAGLSAEDRARLGAAPDRLRADAAALAGAGETR
ncbi:hypothetical protein [Palleronia sp. LCG004]|uniref:hypothetical protein n=1 Tax=Palleronia sp. LCG004 TaxID=3079304 RepID=UPI002941F7FB|nr:hypothetical protein [Palleronia sp. LCG004]WOI57051.1 hypothetical protein RVY76_04485 [Palleronia sp. LCG004]